MKINSLNNNFYSKRTTTFHGAVEDLEKLLQIEKLLQQQHSIEVGQKESYLSDTYCDIDSAKQTIKVLKNRLNSQKNDINQIKSINKNAKETLASIIPGIEILVRKKQEYQEKIKQLPIYKKKLQATADAQIAKKQEECKSIISQQAQHINDSIRKMPEELTSLIVPKPCGFGTIAGFKDIKHELNICLGEPIVLEQNGEHCEVPSGILFYGPDSTNNLNIAKSIASQYGCNCEIIPFGIDDSKKLDYLENVAKKSKNNFNINNKRTLIIIDDFENFIPQNRRDIGIFKGLMDKISSLYKATIIAICNTSEDLDPISIRDGRFNKIPIATAGLKDIIEIVKMHIPLDLFDKVNINDFAKSIFQSQGNSAYSVRQIIELIKSYSDNITKIKEIKPAITHEQLLNFEKQIKLLKYI